MKVTIVDGSVLTVKELSEKHYVGVINNDSKYMIMRLGNNGKGKNSQSRNIVPLKLNSFYNECMCDNFESIEEIYRNISGIFYVFETDKELYKWMSEED